MWRAAEIVERAAQALHEQADAFDQEQAVRGIDALDERALHEVLAGGLERAGYGVLRERGYPSGDDRKLTDRQRCDLVLTPEPGVEPAPQLSKQRRKAAAQPGLFEPPRRIIRQIDASECFWLEVKVVGQFEYVQGVPGPNSSWGPMLVRSVTDDVKKLSSEPGLTHGGLLLVLFTSELEVAKHDVVQLLHRCLDRGLRVSSVDQSSFAIRDRAGNGNCTLTLIGVWRSDEATQSQ